MTIRPLARAPRAACALASIPAHAQSAARPWATDVPCPAGQRAPAVVTLYRDETHSVRLVTVGAEPAGAR